MILPSVLISCVTLSAISYGHVQKQVLAPPVITPGRTFIIQEKEKEITVTEVKVPRVAALVTVMLLLAVMFWAGVLGLLFGYKIFINAAIIVLSMYLFFDVLKKAKGK